MQLPHAPPLWHPSPGRQFCAEAQSPQVPSLRQPVGMVHCAGWVHAPQSIELKHTNPPAHDALLLQGMVHTPLSQTSGLVQSFDTAQG